MKKGIINISGISESRCAPVISDIVKEEGQSLIVTATAAKAARLASDLSFFSDKEILVLPPEEQVFLRYEAKNHDQLIERLKILKALRTGKNCIVVAPVSAAVKKITPHRNFESASVKLSPGSEVDIENLKETLVKLGYERMELVDMRGQFSVRGGIIDVFTPDSEYPYRIELFDTEVDSVRSFDPNTQRSVENLASVEIFPAEQILADKSLFNDAAQRLHREYTTQIKNLMKRGEEFEEAAARLEKRRDELCEYIRNVSNLQLLENYLHYFYEETEYLWDYMEDGTIVIDDPDRICEYLDARSAELKDDFQIFLERGQVIPEDMKLISGKEDFLKVYKYPSVYVLTPFAKMIKGAEQLSQVHSIQSRQMAAFGGRMDFLESELREYVRKNYRITIVCSSKERIENLKEFALRIGLSEKILFEEGLLSSGMDFPEKKICYISENDIFSGQKLSRSKRRKKKTKSEQIQTFSDMRSGDFVVHENHGIGKFLGIEQLTVQGEQKDYLKIKYAGNDMLYVPVEQMDLIQKYIGSDAASPKINKLSGGEWKATKAKAKAAIAQMAQELLQLYAQRKMQKGHSFCEDTVWQKEFEDAFPYTETDDQLRAVSEIKEDMERPAAMDRLLCGDVGFGKTEVAARAIFKCIADGKQAALLVPTTVLANQHYYTLKERFSQFPVEVEMLSRFRSDKQQEHIIDLLNKGQIDLIIGTHRLLSSDVRFKDLGLLVIDEEQRFGVAHKEKIKQLKQNVDVLTLSATPIPRTLNMSLTGIKDMSVIEEPPAERYPVQTYVLEQDDVMIREIITRELDRGGQVFVVYNRVRGINKLADHIRELVPDAQVCVGHGQMNEHMLEDVMLSFVRGEYDVMVATTIIESGIDISNANTMIIIDADKYGLSQLYQLRGRSNRMAYAYLMYQKDKVLTEIAEKRLKAIKEFTEFGAGFKVAMRDLEIRGAGNLLGSEQSGHMMNIGYELYCKLVDDAIRALQGEIVSDREEEISVELAVTANIPNWYIENEVLKLQMYKKIAGVSTEADEDEIVDEMMDRFGDVPRETLNLIRISRIRSLAESLSVTRIYEQQGKVLVSFGEKNSLNGYALMNVNEAFGMKAFVHGGKEPYIRLTVKPSEKLKDTVKLLQILADNMKSSECAAKSNL